MSIIYDALKKTQKQREVEQPNLFLPEKKSVVSWRATLLFILLSFTLIIFLFFPPTFSAKKLIPHVPLLKKSHPNLILNGIFLSPKKKVAMINEKLYSLGDLVYGMKVVEINEKNIRLKNGDTAEVLPLLGAL